MEKYGINYLSILPVRTQATSKSELCTQLLFGEAYTVLKQSRDQRWLYIRNAFEQYEGWIDAGQFQAVSPHFFEKIQHTNPYLSTELLTWIVLDTHTFPIVIGSHLPLYEPNQQIAYLGEKQIKISQHTIQTPGTELGYMQLRDFAFLYLHSPYLWGGKTPFGIDCSGFTQQIYKLVGIPLPRDAYQQAEKGSIVPSLATAQAGDLAFFEREGKIIHVGLLLEEQQIMHALDRVRIDPLDDHGIFNLEKKEYTHELSIIKRFF